MVSDLCNFPEGCSRVFRRKLISKVSKGVEKPPKKCWQFGRHPGQDSDILALRMHGRRPFLGGKFCVTELRRLRTVHVPSERDTIGSSACP